MKEADFNGTLEGLPHEEVSQMRNSIPPVVNDDSDNKEAQQDLLCSQPSEKRKPGQQQVLGTQMASCCWRLWKGLVAVVFTSVIYWTLQQKLCPIKRPKQHLPLWKRPLFQNPPFQAWNEHLCYLPKISDNFNFGQK